MRRIFTLAALIIVLFQGCGMNTVRLENNYGIKAMQMNLNREAEFRFRKLIEKDPSDWAARNNLGVCLEKQGRYEEALAQYEAALEIIKTNRGVEVNKRRVTEILEKND